MSQARILKEACLCACHDLASPAHKPLSDAAVMEGAAVLIKAFPFLQKDYPKACDLAEQVAEAIWAVEAQRVPQDSTL